MNENTNPVQSVLPDPGHVAYIQKRRQENVSDELIRQELGQNDISAEKLTAAFRQAGLANALPAAPVQINSDYEGRAYFVKKISPHVTVVALLFQLFGVLAIIRILPTVLTLTGIFLNPFRIGIFLLYAALCFWIARGLRSRKRSAQIWAIVICAIRAVGSIVIMRSYLTMYEAGRLNGLTVVFGIIDALFLILSLYAIVSLSLTSKEFDKAYWDKQENTVLR